MFKLWAIACCAPIYATQTAFGLVAASGLAITTILYGTAFNVLKIDEKKKNK